MIGYGKMTIKMAIILGSILVLSATSLVGCAKPDTERGTQATESNFQTTESGDQITKSGDQTTESQVQTTESVFQYPAAESNSPDATATSALYEGMEYTQKTISEDGTEAYFGNDTTVILGGKTFDIKERAEWVNAITDIRAAKGYWIVEGHISPNTSYYGFYNIENEQWEKEIFGGCLTWYGEDIDTIVYADGSNLYDSNGASIQAIDLDEAEAEYIHGLKRTNTGVEVYILDGAVEERIVTVDAPLS